jgi:hypothetical protein
MHYCVLTSLVYLFFFLSYDISFLLSFLVKTFEFASHKMLLEYLIRGSGIACRELQPASDLILVLLFSQIPTEESSESKPACDPQPLDSARVCSMQVQVKHLSRPLWPYEVEECFVKMRNLHQDLTPAIYDLFPVSLLLELYLGNSERCQDVPPHQKKTKKKTNLSLPEVTLSFKQGIFEIRVQGLSPRAIFPADTETDMAFRRVLQSTVDLRTCETIPERFRETVTHMFPTQPYMLPATPPKYTKRYSFGSSLA